MYREDTITKTNNGGLKNLKKDRRVICVHPSEDSTKCPVGLVDKYVSLVLEVGPKTKKLNFYLWSLEKHDLAQWYGEMPVGWHTLTKVVRTLLKSAKLDRFFSNHSLHRTSTIGLFQVGVDRKIIKEFTGHSSDVVDKYQITSDQQKDNLSKVLHDEISNITKENREPNLEVTVKEQSEGVPNITSCSCKGQKIKLNETDQIGSMINQIITSRKSGKTTIKIEIEFSD